MGVERLCSHLKLSAPGAKRVASDTEPLGTPDRHRTAVDVASQPTPDGDGGRFVAIEPEGSEHASPRQVAGEDSCGHGGTQHPQATTTPPEQQAGSREETHERADESEETIEEEVGHLGLSARDSDITPRG